MGTPPWVPSTEEIQYIATHNNIEAAEHLRRAPSTIARVRRTYAIDNPALGKPAPTAEPAPSEEPEQAASASAWPLEHASFEHGMWSALESVQRELRLLESEVFETTLELADEQPVLVLWVADTHIGHTNCQMAKLRADLETIRNTPGVYCVLGGDLMDNVVTSVASRGMHHQQLTPVRVQKQLVEEAVDYLGRENVLAMVLGNHDAWSIAQDDFDPIAYFAKRIGCPYLGPFGFVNVQLGSQLYRLLAAHQFRMRSSFNLTHQAKRLEDFVGDADVVFTGHTHESAVESTQRRGMKKFYGQAGSYLASSRYSKSLGFGEVTAEMPGVILWPAQHKVLGFHDGFGDGVAYLRYLRGQ